jgi:hypothetical protein
MNPAAVKKREEELEIIKE